MVVTEIHQPVTASAPADAEARPGDAAAADPAPPTQPTTGDATGTRRGWRLGGPADRTALLIWFFWHVAAYIYMVLAAPGRTDAPLLDRLTPWDSDNFITIAQYGYDGSPGMT